MFPEIMRADVRNKIPSLTRSCVDYGVTNQRWDSLFTVFFQVTPIIETFAQGLLEISTDCREL